MHVAVEARERRTNARPEEEQREPDQPDEDHADEKNPLPPSNPRGLRHDDYLHSDQATYRWSSGVYQTPRRWLRSSVRGHTLPIGGRWRVLNQA
jgi:hypothetical protein